MVAVPIPMIPVGSLVAVGLRQQRAQPQQRKFVQDESGSVDTAASRSIAASASSEVGRTAAAQEHFDQRRHGGPTRHMSPDA